MAIAAITEFGNNKYSVYLSVDWTIMNANSDPGRFSYGEVIKITDSEIISRLDEVIKVVAESQIDRHGGSVDCRSGANFEWADRSIRRFLYMMQYSTDAPFNITAKARHIAAAIRDVDVVLPEGRLLDLTDELAAIGINPFDAVPNYPDLTVPPNRIYASAVTGDCAGVAIAAIGEYNLPQNYVDLSIVWSDNTVLFRSMMLSHDEVIGLIAEAQLQRQRDGEDCRSGIKFDWADRRFRHFLDLKQFSTDAPFNNAEKARRVAAAIRGLGVIPPEGRLLDLTDDLAAVGIRPADAVPDFPMEIPFPSKLYASALTGDCGGVAIAANVEYSDFNYPKKIVYLSIVWNDEKTIFRLATMSHSEVIELIAEAQEERRRVGC